MAIPNFVWLVSFGVGFQKFYILSNVGSDFGIAALGQISL